MKVLLLVATLVASAYSQAYTFSDGYFDVLGYEPSNTFSCADRSYGYYADVDSNCQVFHVCVPISDDYGDLVETQQFSFFCGNQTVFSQETLTCSHPEDAYPCDQAAGYYDIINAEFGKIPDEFNKK